MYDTLQTHTINTYNHMLTWQPPCKGDVRIINILQKREQTQWGVFTHSRSLCQGSTNHPKFSDLLGGLTGLYMSIQSYARLRFIQGGEPKQNRQRKRHMGKMWRKRSQAPKSSLLWNRTMYVSLPQLWQHLWNVVVWGSSLETQYTGFLLGGLLPRHPLLSTYQNSRVLEGKQLLSVNHIVFIQTI